MHTENRIKRLFDIVLATVGVVFFFPCCITIIIILLFSNKGKVFYLQQRIGKDEIPFVIIKFRTLNKESKPSFFSRLLRSTAMDELPQLISILKGDMSFVGPRPLMISEITSMKEGELFKQRSRITPGLTGCAQIFLSKKSSLKEKFLYDIWYGMHKNFLLDIELIGISLMITFLRSWETEKKKIFLWNKLDSEIKNAVAIRGNKG